MTVKYILSLMKVTDWNVVEYIIFYLTVIDFTNTFLQVVMRERSYAGLPQVQVAFAPQGLNLTWVVSVEEWVFQAPKVESHTDHHQPCPIPTASPQLLEGKTYFCLNNKTYYKCGGVVPLLAYLGTLHKCAFLLGCDTLWVLGPTSLLNLVLPEP